MLNLSSLKFFEELLRTSGPSGYEIPCAQVFRKRLEKYADEIKVDVTGNSIAVLNPKSPFKVMLAGHYDNELIGRQNYIFNTAHHLSKKRTAA